MISATAREPSGWTPTSTYADGSVNDFAAASPGAGRQNRAAARRAAALRR
jgi:hypothetical protein